MEPAIGNGENETIVAFRATALTYTGIHGNTHTNTFFHRQGSFLRNRISTNFYKAIWKNIEYNHGNCFDGSIFTAPVKGIYSFVMKIQQTPFGSAIYRTYYMLNDIEVLNSKRSNNNVSSQEPYLLLTTMKLEKDDKVTVTVGDILHVYKFDCPKTTYFEGRLVSVINE